MKGGSLECIFVERFPGKMGQGSRLIPVYFPGGQHGAVVLSCPWAKGTVIPGH